MKKLFLAITMLATIGAGVIWPAVVSAGTGTVYLTPSTTSAQQGSSFGLSLRINPGTNVDGVQATISVDTSKLQITSVDTNVTAFPALLQKSVSSSTAVLAMGNLSGGVSTDSLIAVVNFSAVAGSGSTTVNLSNVNASSSGSYTNPGSAGATVSFTTPPYTPPSTGSSGSTGTSSSSGSSKKRASSNSTSTPAASPTAAAPVVKPKFTSDIKNLQFDLAQLNVKTDIPVQIAAKYGTSKDNLDQITDYSALGTNSTVGFDKTKLIPGTTYYYQILAKDAAGNVTTSDVKSFKTKGYHIEIAVLDSKYQPIAGKKVTLHSSPITATTDSKGVASFDDVAPGQHSIEYILGQTTYKQNLFVDNNVTAKNGVETAAMQDLAVIFGGVNQPVKHKYTIQTVVSVAVAAVLFILLLIDMTPLGDGIRAKVSKLIHFIGGQKHKLNSVPKI